MGTKKEVFRERLEEYLKASKQEKCKILDALQIITGMHRKAVVRALRHEQMRDRMKPRKKSGPQCLYTPDVIAALKDIWSAGNEVCGELMHPLVGEYRIHRHLHS